MIGQELLAEKTAVAETSPASPDDQLRRQLSQAQRLCSIGELASSMAHEFNNVLTTILNSAKMGSRAKDLKSAQSACDKVIKSGQRAAAVVQSMLGFARHQSEERRPTDLSKLMDDVLTLTDKDLAKHRVQVERHDTGNTTAEVIAGQIEQIFVNLIINARQSMPRGGRIRIDIRQNHKTDMVEVRVADTGAGIPPEGLRKIFDPFYTTKEPDETGRGGTGLGLSVCRQIVEQHHGRIRVESVVGKGSAFTVKLPRKPEHG